MSQPNVTLTPVARRTYTDADKAQALELYETHGAAETARRTGIPEGTLQSWAFRAGVKSVATERTATAVRAAKVKWEERRLQMADNIGAAADMALEQTINALADGHARTAKDAATTMAILVDKAQLLTGAATGRHETVVVGQIEQEIARLEAELLAS